MASEAVASNNRIERLVLNELLGDYLQTHITLNNQAKINFSDTTKKYIIISPNQDVFVYEGYSYMEEVANVPDIYIVQTIGDGNCILHSILFATSPTYRNANKSKRVLIADLFRKWISDHYDEMKEFVRNMMNPNMELFNMEFDSIHEFHRNSRNMVGKNKKYKGDYMRVYIDLKWGYIISQYFGYNFLPFFSKKPVIIKSVVQSPRVISISDDNNHIIDQNATINGTIPFDVNQQTIIIHYLYGSHFESVIGGPVTKGNLTVTEKGKPILVPICTLSDQTRYTFRTEEIENLLALYSPNLINRNDINNELKSFRNLYGISNAEIKKLQKYHPSNKGKNATANSLYHTYQDYREQIAPAANHTRKNAKQAILPASASLNKKKPLEQKFINFFKNHGITRRVNKEAFLRALKSRKNSQPNMQDKLAAWNAFKKTYKASNEAARFSMINLRARLEAAKRKKAANNTKKATKKTQDTLINSFFETNPKTRTITKNTFKKALNDRVSGHQTSNNTMKDLFLNWDWHIQNQQAL